MQLLFLNLVHDKGVLLSYCFEHFPKIPNYKTATYILERWLWFYKMLNCSTNPICVLKYVKLKSWSL